MIQIEHPILDQKHWPYIEHEVQGNIQYVQSKLFTIIAIRTVKWFDELLDTKLEQFINWYLRVSKFDPIFLFTKQ